MIALEHFIHLAESSTSSNIEIFCPKLSMSFLWKVIEDLSIYRRKNLNKLVIYFSSFINSNQYEFLLNECIEMQELFKKVEIFFIDLKKIGFNEETIAGLIIISDHVERVYSYESEFSLDGFNGESSISLIFGDKRQALIDGTRMNSIRVDRMSLNSLRNRNEDSKPSFFAHCTISNKDPNFELSFLATRTNQIHNAGAGLNWGQPTSSRKRKDKNAAYLPIQTYLQNNPSIPGQNIKFLCKFDDGIEIEMVRTGQSGKNLTNAYDNQIFGRYIRSVLRLSSGALITQENLMNASIFGMRFFKEFELKYFVQFKKH